MNDLEITKKCAQAMGFVLRPEHDSAGLLAIHDEIDGYTFYDPLHEDDQAMALLRWLVRYNENECVEITNHTFHYNHRERNFTQLGGFSRPDHLRRAICECVAKMVTP